MGDSHAVGLHLPQPPKTRKRGSFHEHSLRGKFLQERLRGWLGTFFQLRASGDPPAWSWHRPRWTFSIPGMWLSTGVISALGFHSSWLQSRLSFLRGISELLSVLALAPAELPCTWMTESLSSLLKKVSTESYKPTITFSCPGQTNPTPYGPSVVYPLLPMAEIPAATSRERAGHLT